MVVLKGGFAHSFFRDTNIPVYVEVYDSLVPVTSMATGLAQVIFNFDFHSILMNFLKLVIPFHSLYTGQFTPKMKANAEPRLLSSLV